MDHLVSSIGLDQTIDVLNTHPDQLYNTARVNLLKISRNECIAKLHNEGIKAKPIPELAEGIFITRGWKKIGSSLTYLEGCLMPQGYGSMLTVHSLDPQPGEVVLDMAAAPGGKSCYIGERMQNTGLLIANERSYKRIQSLIHNLMRHSIENVIITQNDAAKINIDSVDRVLLDAPCSGDGLIISNPSRKKSKSIINSFSMQRIQINLLSNALSLLKPKGICVYSTCSLNTIENEQVLFPLKDKFKIEKINIPGISGVKSIHEEFGKTKRLLPSTHHCDGFFIAKLRKL
ncbi:MAG: RsmB/NOP family class I SAM-dependent RNA methyltransferase [Candidatus Heimdallarchaeota archaeon]|nr:RsmB/NOP family class I SAM-dependent RNA methyltransferase [Candidatus Heimdallarchaeota archaeon]